MAESDQRSGEGEEGAVHVTVALVADAQAAELVGGQLSVRSDNPAFAAQPAAMGRARLARCGTMPSARSRARQADEQREELAGVVVVGRRDGRDQWDAVGVGQDVVLGARLGPVDRIRPRLGPPKTARTLLESTATRDQPIFPARSSRRMSAVWSRSHTPAASHVRCRRPAPAAGLPNRCPFSARR